jgi:hypothetical protein
MSISVVATRSATATRQERFPANASQRLADILYESHDHRQTALVAVAFLRRFNASKPQPGHSNRFVGSDAAPDVVIGQQADMRLEFLCQIAVGTSEVKRFQ